jgi:hypothetical protein
MHHPIGQQFHAIKPAKPAVPSGHGRRPHPFALNNRFKFCPAAMNSPSMFTFCSPRSLNCRIPCHCFASPKSGSIQTFRLRIAFLERV